MRPATLHIRRGVIERVGDYGEPCDEDAGDMAILPGLVDTHVHINEPGRTEWEGFSTATRAAAAGGVTTLIEMPLNSIPATTTPAALEEKISAATGNCYVDVGFWGGVVPGNANQIQALFDAGCFGFKCFLSPSGVDEFRNVSEADLREVMPTLSQMSAVLQAHAELPAYLLEATGDPRVYTNYLASRPPLAEQNAIDLLIRLSRETSCRVHIVHLACGEALANLKVARSAGLPITIETCPHYLVFSADEIPDGATEFKCAPPIRSAKTRETLWKALMEGTIDAVVTDHSPCPPGMKLKERGDFFKAWGGIASLQLGLSAIWTEAIDRNFTLNEIARWMCAAPARLAGLTQKKGSIAPGMDADLVLFDTDAEWTVDPGALHHRHKVTPYSGRKLKGVVQKTYLRGEPVLPLDPPRGNVLRRGAV
jgi:allantoinase